MTHNLLLRELLREHYATGPVRWGEGDTCADQQHRQQELLAAFAPAYDQRPHLQQPKARLRQQVEASAIPATPRHQPRHKCRICGQFERLMPFGLAAHYRAGRRCPGSGHPPASQKRPPATTPSNNDKEPR